MEKDSWDILKQFTNARIALGRAGNALPTHEVLQLKMAHSRAKDAIYSAIDIKALTTGFRSMQLQTITVKSEIASKHEYLINPNKGRLLNSESILELEQLNISAVDLCIIVADGLSANAVNKNAIPLLNLLLPQIKNLTIAPIIVAEYGRVALSDSIGEILHARIALILIGERPGLSSPESMAAYLTYHPKSGNTDEKRNCISNIHPEGLHLDIAAAKLSYLLNQMLIKQLSGVQLKDNFNDIYLT